MTKPTMQRIELREFRAIVAHAGRCHFLLQVEFNYIIYQCLDITNRIRVRTLCF